MKKIGGKYRREDCRIVKEDTGHFVAEASNIEMADRIVGCLNACYTLTNDILKTDFVEDVIVSEFFSGTYWWSDANGDDIEIFQIMEGDDERQPRQ